MSSTKNRRLTETPVCYKVCCMCSTITYVITLRHTQHKREIHLTVTVLNVFFCNASWICSVIMILSHRYLNNESTVIIHFRCKLRLLFEKQFSRKAIQMSDVLWLWSLCYMLWIRSNFYTTYNRPSCTMYNYTIRFRWVYYNDYILILS